MIISISGTPKTGKTSVAKALAKKLGWKLISLNQLAERKRLYLGYDKSRKSKIVDIKKLRMEVLKIARGKGKTEGGKAAFFRKSRNLIIESHYSHDMPCDVVVILRTNPAELRKRMSRKGWPRKKIEENVEAEIMEIVRSEALESAKKVLEIDTTGRKPAWVAEQIARRLSLKRNRLEPK